MMIEKAMVLAAGLGTRMRPITDTMPKPLIEVAGRCLLDRALDLVQEAGIKAAVVNTSYKAGMIESHLANRHNPAITISHEEQPLETGGGIAKALPVLGSFPFISMNSDTICVSGQMNALIRLMHVFDPDAMDIVMLLHPREKAVGFDGKGDFIRSETGTIKRRDTSGERPAPFVFTGIQIVHPRIFTDLPEPPFSMNMIYDRYVQADGWMNARIYTIIHDGDWLHVGDPKGLEEANMFFKHAA